MSSPSAEVRTMAMLAAAFARRGQRVPIAVVASIFDDVLAGATGEGGAGGLAFEDVLVGEDGAASLGEVRAAVPAIAGLFVRALDGEIPPDAAMLVARIEGGEIEDQPRDAEELRGWIRDALGVIAPREEVLAAFREEAGVLGVSVEPEHSDAISSSPPVLDDYVLPIVTAIPAPVTAIPAPVESAPPEPSVVSVAPEPSVASAAPEPSVAPEPEARVELAPPVPEAAPLSEPPVLAADAIDSDIPTQPPVRTADGRPIIRHQLPRPSVSVLTAPAARRSARPALDARDVLGIPGEHTSWRVWAAVAVFAIVLALCWFKLL